MKSSRRTLVPLAMIGEGEAARIVGIIGGIGLRRRLMELGLNPGIAINVVRNSYAGPIILELGGVRLAIGRGVAGKILVEVET